MAGRLELTDKAHNRVEEILAEEQRLPMDAGTDKLISEILEEAAAKLR